MYCHTQKARQYRRLVRKSTLLILFLILFSFPQTLLYANISYQEGEALKFTNDKEEINFRFLHYFGQRAHVFKGINEATQEEMVAKEVRDNEVKLTKELVPRIRSVIQYGTPSIYHKKIVTADLFKLSGSEDKDYILMPYIKGKDFSEYFNLPTGLDPGEEYPREYDLSAISEELISKIIEGVEIVRFFIAFGYTPEDLNKSNFLIHDDDKSVYLIDYLEHAYPVGNIYKNTLNFINFFHLIHPFGGIDYPYTDYEDCFCKLEKPLIYFKMTKDEKTNDWINQKLVIILKKINDLSYLYDKEIYDSSGLTIEQTQKAYGEFIEDLKSILVAIQEGKKEPLDKKSEKLTNEQIADYYARIQCCRAGNLRVFYLGNFIMGDYFHANYIITLQSSFPQGAPFPDYNDDKNVAMTFLRVPIVDNDYEDIIFLKEEFSLKDLQLVFNHPEAKDFFYNSKKSIAVVYPDKKDFKKKRMQKPLEKYFRKTLEIDRDLRFVPLR